MRRGPIRRRFLGGALHKNAFQDSPRRVPATPPLSFRIIARAGFSFWRRSFLGSPIFSDTFNGVAGSAVHTAAALTDAENYQPTLRELEAAAGRQQRGRKASPNLPFSPRRCAPSKLVGRYGVFGQA
jgi:hypothetical protein